MGLFAGLSVCLLITECRVDGDGVVGSARVGLVHVGHHQRVGEGAGEVNIHRCLVHPERKRKSEEENDVRHLLTQLQPCQ